MIGDTDYLEAVGGGLELIQFAPSLVTPIVPDQLQDVMNNRNGYYGGDISGNGGSSTGTSTINQRNDGGLPYLGLDKTSTYDPHVVMTTINERLNDASQIGPNNRS